MNYFLKLTDFGDGAETLVNVAHIARLKASEDHTAIEQTHRVGTIHVTETVAQIEKMLTNTHFPEKMPMAAKILVAPFTPESNE